MIALMVAPLSAVRADDKTTGETATLPRYRLEVGQELVFQGSGQFKYVNSTLSEQVTWSIWVLRSNPDKSWRLVIQETSITKEVDRDGKVLFPEDKYVHMAYADFHPDGRIVPNDSFGKVVVLDFWYRGCGWCIQCMPQMKEIASHFRGQPVAIFGMNTDEKVEAAKFIVKKLGLNYPSLRAKGLPEKYKVKGFPTLIIIDQKGIIRDIHVGYSPRLRVEVVEAVERLLKEVGN
jgi:thiol-disulfide isomerase/thioredoxin